MGAIGFAVFAIGVVLAVAGLVTLSAGVTAAEVELPPMPDAAGTKGRAVRTCVSPDGDEDNDAAPGSGAVFVYVQDGPSWSKQAYIKASNTDNTDGFGTSVVRQAAASLRPARRRASSSARALSSSPCCSSCRNSRHRVCGNSWAWAAPEPASNPRALLASFMAES